MRKKIIIIIKSKLLVFYKGENFLKMPQDFYSSIIITENQIYSEDESCFEYETKSSMNICEQTLKESPAGREFLFLLNMRKALEDIEIGEESEEILE